MGSCAIPFSLSMLSRPVHVDLVCRSAQRAGGYQISLEIVFGSQDISGDRMTADDGWTVRTMNLVPTVPLLFDDDS